MKNSFLIIMIVLGALVSGCDKNFEEINIDPTKLTPGNMNFHYMFTSAQLVTSGNSDGNAYEDWRNNLIYASTMIQHLSSTTGYWAGDKYTYNPGYNSAYWDANYPNSVKNIVEVVENTRDDAALANFHQIARIFKVFMLHRLTDMYGDIPYTQAGLGYINGTTHPVYDKQQDIYMDMLKELKEAAEALDAAKANTLNNSDLMYKGDVAKWKKFAYSLMVRLSMRMTKVAAGDAETWVKAAVAGGVMASNDDNALIQHQAVDRNTVTNGNAWVLVGVDADASRMSQTFIDMLKNTSDPRLTYLATVVSNPTVLDDKGNSNPAVQLGQPNGYDLGGAATDISKASNWPGNRNMYSVVNRNTFARKNAPTFFLTHAETQLLLAEAAQRGWITGTAATYYNAGVTAAMKQLNQTGANPGVSDPEITTYLGANAYNPATGLQQINTQYWIATFMDEYEAWANWRRSGFPVLTPVNYFGNVTGGTIPRRFTYPTNEAAVNPENYNAAVSALQGGDKMTSRVWWDKP
jgi:hypothetical protein